MLAPTGSSLSQFVDAYHLWFVLLPLYFLGVYHALDLVVYLWFKFLAVANEAYYAYKTRCVENRRRYEQVAREGPGRAIAHRAGAD